MWSNISLAVYVAAIIGLAAALLQHLGLGIYDATANTFDPDPISLTTLSAWVAGILAAGLAAIRNLGGWGRK